MFTAPATPAPVVPEDQIPKFDTRDVAQVTGESEATVRRRCADGSYPHTRFGRALRFTRQDVATILTAARRDADSESPIYDGLVAEQH